jgi:hypothetical protein
MRIERAVRTRSRRAHIITVVVTPGAPRWRPRPGARHPEAAGDQDDRWYKTWGDSTCDCTRRDAAWSCGVCRARCRDIAAGYDGGSSDAVQLPEQRRTHSQIRRPTPRRRQDHPRDHARPQTLRRTRDLSPPCRVTIGSGGPTPRMPRHQPVVLRTIRRPAAPTGSAPHGPIRARPHRVAHHRSASTAEHPSTTHRSIAPERVRSAQNCGVAEIPGERGSYRRSGLVGYEGQGPSPSSAGWGRARHFSASGPLVMGRLPASRSADSDEPATGWRRWGSARFMLTAGCRLWVESREGN